jgi:hypothetical protein
MELGPSLQVKRAPDGVSGSASANGENRLSLNAASYRLNKGARMAANNREKFTNRFALISRDHSPGRFYHATLT